MNATQIISALSAARVRATYGAVAQVLGIPPRAVSGLLGTRRPETSWVVSARTGLPTGYLPHEMHENFGTNSRILCSGGELTEFLSKSVPTGDPKHTTSDAAQLVGVDLAWNCEKNGTGIAIGAHDGKNLTVATVYTNVVGLDVIQNLIVATPNAKGVAIDAPLIIKNSKGSRPCEKDLTGTFGSRGLPPIQSPTPREQRRSAACW